MDEKLLEKIDIIQQKLEKIDAKLDDIKKDTQSVAKHVPFVDKLSSIGTLGCISSLNRVVKAFNPVNYLPDRKKIKQIKGIEEE